MWFPVNPRSATPIYQQLVDGIKESVAKGVLPYGTKLPSVRELASTLTLNHNTVAKAYQQLEREGVIEVIQGRGTYVTAAFPGEPPDYRARLAKLEDMMKQMLVEAHYLNLGDDALLSLLVATMNEWKKGRTGS